MSLRLLLIKNRKFLNVCSRQVMPTVDNGAIWQANLNHAAGFRRHVEGKKVWIGTSAYVGSDGVGTCGRTSMLSSGSSKSPIKACSQEAKWTYWTKW